MFKPGDYVVVSNPDETTDYDERDTFRVIDSARNLFGRTTVRVARIDNSRLTTVFYPHELSLEG